MFEETKKKATEPKPKPPKRWINGMPERWWEESEGIQVESMKHYKQLMMKGKNSELHGKHVFLDFFMEACHYCYRFQSDWNKLADKIGSLYKD